MRILLPLLFVLFIPPGVTNATTYFVDPYGNGDFTRIQPAINATVSGDIIELADARYTGDGNRDLDFGGREITLRSRNGDPQACIIDCQGSWHEPRRAFYFHSWEGPDNTFIEGIRIVNGDRWNYQGWPYQHGGAVLCYRASPTFIRCIFDRNQAAFGGHVYCHTASPKFVDCTFYRGWADQAGTAVNSHENSHVTLTNCIVAWGDGEDGAIACSYGGTVTLTCCDLYGNVGGDWAGCIADQYGINGNIALDPQLCDPENAIFELQATSPCAEGNNPECGQIGAEPVGCWPTPVRCVTWGGMRALFR